MTVSRDPEPFPEDGSAPPDGAQRPVSLRTENLAIVFTDIVGYTARTARQSREENARLLAEHDRMLLPLVRAFGGKRVKSIGDALLLTFRSPTDSVLCGMAMQDRLAQYNATLPESERLIIRVAINLGEVRLERGDVFGEPVNVAARLEHETPPGEVWLTDAVQLSMNRAEVPLLEVGTRELRGVSQPVRIHRVQRSEVGLPFGGVSLVRSPASRLNAKAWAGALRALAWSTPGRRRWLVAAGAAAALVLAAIALLASSPVPRAERALANGDSERALRLLEQADRTPSSLVLKGRALRLARRPQEAMSAWEEAAKLDPDALDQGEVLSALEDELGGARSQSGADLLGRLGAAGKRTLVGATHSDSYRRRWAAVEALRLVYPDEQLDLREVYLADLKVRDCNVVTRAAGKLADLGETKAIEPLREVAQRRAVLGLAEACEVPAARAALKKLEKR